MSNFHFAPGVRLVIDKTRCHIVRRLSGQRWQIENEVCPLCVKELGYCDAMWDVIYSCVCPHHGIYLIDTCPKCSKKLCWNRGHVGRCACGADLTEGNHIEAGLALRYLNAKLWVASGNNVQVIADGFPDTHFFTQ